MKRFLLLLSSFTGATLVFSAFLYLTDLSEQQPGARTNPPVAIPEKIIERLASYAVEAKQFVRKHGFNKSLCLLIDMNIESGHDRFFLYNLLKDSVLDKGLVTHGRCNELWLTGRKYGNEIGCGCTSLGKYKIGHAYNGKFGLAYKLNGLDSTNSNAFNRYVVLHAHECVPDEEVHPYPICQSDGCPTVSKKFLKKLAGVIDTCSQPVLLWIYD